MQIGWESLSCSALCGGLLLYVSCRFFMAKKKKFHYNPETLSFEEVRTTFKSISGKFFLQILAGAFIGIIFFLAFSFFLDSPEERRLKRENRQLEIQYRLLNRKYDEMNAVLSSLRQRDNNLYRVIFQADSIPEAIRHKTMTGSRSYDELSDMSTVAVFLEAKNKSEDLERQIYIQSKSYDDIVELLAEHAEKLRHIPAIQPVLNRDLRRLASGFGYRIDPVYRTRRMHQGMDFSAPVGTDIFATGDGMVTYAGWKQGYGNTVVIDHGFGYETLYGHMHKIDVRVNQKVTRAEVIGHVGNTGKSTGPHLHYEVIYRGNHVDPLNFYFLDLSPEEYDQMIHLAQNAGQVMD